jgi:hypothetical protein
MYVNHDLNHVHREEMMREAQNERLVRQAMHGMKRGRHPLLNSLGRQMVKWGERLQGNS